jgi:uncharacterized membrane protein
MTLNRGSKEWLAFVIAMLLLTDLAILLNIPFVRQIFGFLFLTILPGLLILQILKLNKIGFTEKIVLSVGLSISFLMFFGLLINNLSLNFGYETPLSTISLLISFNIIFIVLAIIGYRINKDQLLSLPSLNLNTSEKAFLIVPILFPALSILGTHFMKTADNNTILMFLLFLIPAYIVFVCFFNQKFPNRLYPVVIFLISISLLLLMSLRSNHIIGMDAHMEYYFFQTALNNLHWSIWGHSVLNACLIISLLPTIYQSFLNISPEFLYKILYSMLFSVSPIVIYVLSKKYIEESYAFLASIFFMSQITFLWTAYNPRTNIAILFFALAMMTLFNDRIDPLKKRTLFIVFMASCMVSHYSTTYIFFFIMLGTFVGIEVLSKKYTFKKVVSSTITILFFAMIFFWYSQVTETAFNAGVSFVENTLSNLNKFFIEETRGQAQALLGKDIGEKGIPHKIEFVFTWLTLALTAIGVITLIIRRKKMSFPELKFKKPEFLKDKFEVTYFVIALVCSGLLVVMVALPYVAVGYNMDRLYCMVTTILSVFFVIGGITLSKQIFKKSLIKNFSFNKKPLLKKQKKGRKGVIWGEKENDSQVGAYLIILLVLIPYFFCVTGVMYNIFGVPRAIILNSEGEQYDEMYVHDQDSYGAKWLKSNTERARIYGDSSGITFLFSQGMIRSPIYVTSHLKAGKAIKDGYIYLRYTGVVGGKLLDWSGKGYNITEFEGKFGDNCKIYDNGGSEVWR